MLKGASDIKNDQARCDSVVLYSYNFQENSKACTDNVALTTFDVYKWSS